MTVYKNGTLLGVMQPEGLNAVRGYNWAVSMGFTGDSVAVESHPVPPSDGLVSEREQGGGEEAL